MSSSTGAESRGLIGLALGVLYDGAWGTLAFLTRPLALFGGKRWREKSGLYDIRASTPHCWIHACSVGEVRVALRLVGEIRRRRPALSFTLSTVTPEGLAAARAGLDGAHDAAVFFPFDARRAMIRAFDRLNPDFVILTEVELWPNHLREAAARGIPVFVINGRLTAEDEKHYRRAGRLMRRAFSVPELVCARGPEEAGRFERLGARRIVTAGDIKYETLLRAPTTAAGREKNLLLGASTHEGEEEILLRALRRLRREFPALRLVIAPRHPRRAAALVRLAIRHGFNAGLSSQREPAGDVVVVDEIGRLLDYYDKATVCFVGKSLTARGGQNFLEASASGCPIVTGPHLENFAAAAERFLAGNAMITVANAGALEGALTRLLSDGAERERMTSAAASIMRENSGAAGRTAELLLASLGSRV